MSIIGRRKVRIAVIDMNNGAPNQGMRGIQEILQRYAHATGIEIVYDIFDLRQKGEIPSISYDIFISSGGPGDPFEGEGEKWDTDFCNLLDEIDRYNKVNRDKKHVFLICHSFQLACRKYNIGKVIRRRSTAFGIFPVVATAEGESEQIFSGLPNPFYAVENRNWQVISPEGLDYTELDKASLLAIEKERPHVDLQRCYMAVRFSNEIIGTQFHPEADPEGMKMYLTQDEKRRSIMEIHGVHKYNDMLSSLENPNRIRLTQQVILPNFLDQAIKALKED